MTADWVKAWTAYLRHIFFNPIHMIISNTETLTPAFHVTISLCFALMETERLSGGLMDGFSFRSFVIHKILMDLGALFLWMCSVKQSCLSDQPHLVQSRPCSRCFCLYVSSHVNSLQQLLRFTHRCYKWRKDVFPSALSWFANICKHSSNLLDEHLGQRGHFFLLFTHCFFSPCEGSHKPVRERHGD